MINSVYGGPGDNWTRIGDSWVNCSNKGIFHWFILKGVWYLLAGIAFFIAWLCV